jgi:hypothetical protein
MQWINETWVHLSPWIGTIGAVMCLTLHIVGQWKSRHANVTAMASADTNLNQHQEPK